jgi:Ca-activated chloride channel family protein
MKFATQLVAIAGITWSGLWFTPDQLGQRRMKQGDFQAAAEIFHDPMRQGVAWFRAGEFEKAEQAFARYNSADAEYNRANCLVMLGKYEMAVERYERAMELRPGFEDAQINREIAMTRARLLERKGSDMGDQTIGADEVTFDKSPNTEGQDTEVQGDQPLSDAEMQALWLRRVQTKPADFLKAKFNYQLSEGASAGVAP